MLSGISTSILQSARRTIKDIVHGVWSVIIFTFALLHCCDTTSCSHISILRLGFICFISYCPICHTTTPKVSRSSCDGSGRHHPGSCSCHSRSSTAYSVGQGSHGCSSGGNCSSHHDPSGCSLIRGTHQTLLRLTSMVSTSNLQTPLTLKILPNDNAKWTLILCLPSFFE